MADDGGSSILSTQQQAVIQPLVCDLDILNQTDISSSGKKVLENTIDNSLQQLSDLELNKVHNFLSAMNPNCLMWSELIIGTAFPV